MAGLGLSDAVSGYQQGARWKDQQDEIAREKSRRDTLDAVNQQAAGVVKQAEEADYGNQRKAWLDGGGDNAQFQAKPFQPPDNLMFKVSQERGSSLMKAGLVEEAVKNEALTQAQRMRVRQSALDRFRMDRDHSKLASMIYDTVPDGKSIVSATTIEGAPAGDAGGPLAGMPMRPSKIQLKLSDGSTHSTTPEEIEKIALRLSDPKFSEHEAAANLVRLKAEYEAEKAKDVEGYKATREERNIVRRGEEDRRTAGVKAGADMSLAQFNKGADGERSAATNRTSLAVAATGAEASKYGADKRVEAAGGKEAKKTADQKTAQDLPKLQEMITKSYGEETSGLMGGTRLSSDATMKQAIGVQRLMADNPDMALGDALIQVRKDYEARPKPAAKK